jgi:hypothetical protein
LRTLTFSGGHANYTIPAGASVVSDPVLNFDGLGKAGTVLSVSLYLATGQTTNFITGHPGSRTTSFMAPGNLVAEPDLLAANATVAAGRVSSVAHWYFVAAVEAWLPVETASLVVVGDSITDGRGSTTDGNNRWPDQLLARMQAEGGGRDRFSVKNLAVVNKAAGGNRVLYDGLGPNALSRIDRDVLARPGVGYVIVYEGVNDLGTCSTDVTAQESVSVFFRFVFSVVLVRRLSITHLAVISWG